MFFMFFLMFLDLSHHRIFLVFFLRCFKQLICFFVCVCFLFDNSIVSLFSNIC